MRFEVFSENKFYICFLTVFRKYFLNLIHNYKYLNSKINLINITIIIIIIIIKPFLEISYFFTQ